MTSILSEDFLDLGHTRFVEVSEEQEALKLSNGGEPNSATKGKWEVAAVISTATSNWIANRTFLNLLKRELPDYGFSKIWSLEGVNGFDYIRPRVYSNRWENVAINDNEETKLRCEYFNIFDPKGKFYHLRSLDDDLYFDRETKSSGQCFDVHLPIVQCIQSIKTILKIAKNFELQEKDYIEISFRWRGLSNRELASWLLKESYFNLEYKAYQDGITITIFVNPNTELAKLHPKIHYLLLPVYRLFEGFEIDTERVNSAVQYCLKE